MKEGEIVLQVLVSSDLKDQLEELAKKDHRTLSGFLRKYFYELTKDVTLCEPSKYNARLINKKLLKPSFKNTFKLDL